MSDATMHTTGYARLRPLAARVVLGVIALAMVAGVAVTLSPLGSTNYVPGRKEPGDVPLYRSEVDRIHNGEGYYHAAAVELTARGYPTQSVFNWRVPLPMWLIGNLPSVTFGMVLLGAMALLLMLLAFEALAGEEEETFSCRRHGDDMAVYTRPLADVPSAAKRINRGHEQNIWRPLACVLLLIGSLLPTILGDLFVMPSLWAGVLMALSACAYGVGRPWLGVTSGLAAIFFRELALPYGLVCAALAWRRGRRNEWAVWMLGLLVWAVLFSLHCWYVSGLIAPDALAHSQSWLQFGGAGFVISTVQVNAFLILLPQWISAIYLVAALVGLAGWNTALGQRIGLSACLFLTAFAIIGHSFNQYWGLLIGPLLCFGVVRFPTSLHDLSIAANAHCPSLSKTV